MALDTPLLPRSAEFASTAEQPSTPTLASVPDTIAAFARGEFVIFLDDPSRENEGDLILAAQDMTPAKMAFMIRYTSGYICLSIPEARANYLALPQMVSENTDPTRCAYAVTVDGNHPSITTGISAADRALTCRMLADPATTAASLRRPGHVLPLRAKDSGIRVRYGHTEAAVELCRLAQKQQAAVLCEMVREGDEEPSGRAERINGGMMRRDDCLEFGKRWGIKVCTIQDLVAYVEATEGSLGIPGSLY